jgi:hypothetical protein
MPDKMNIDDFKLIGLDVKNYNFFKNIYKITIKNDPKQIAILKTLDYIDLKEINTSNEEVILNELCD